MIKAYISSEAVVVPPAPMLFWLKYMFRMLGVCVKRYIVLFTVVTTWPRWVVLQRALSTPKGCLGRE